MTRIQLIKKTAEVAALCDLLQVMDAKSSGLAATLPGRKAAWRRLTGQQLVGYITAAERPVYDDKYERTVAKIGVMMETYIGGEWDNGVEIMEWCGFHCGAGIVHAALVAGSAGGELSASAAALQRDFQALLDGTAMRLQKQTGR